MRFLFLVVLLSPLLATAGNAPAGAPCTNPNQCLSHTCSQKRCAPSTDYPAGIGGFCSTNGTCKSKNCVRSKCEAPKEEKSKTSSNKGGGGSTRSAPDDDEDEEEAPKAKEPEPLPEPTPCSEDLIATVYKGDNSRKHQFYARDNCKYYSPEIIDQAKKLFFDGIGQNFHVTLSTLKEATPEQVACAKKEYDKRRHGNFEIPNLCRQSSAVIACADELSPSVFKDKDDAKDECKKRSPAVIAEAKKMYLEKYGDSFRNIADVLEKARPDQVECTKREYEFKTEGRTKNAGYSWSGVCERDAEVIACYFDLLDHEMKPYRFDQSERQSVEALCRRTDPLDVEAFALARKLYKAGYTMSFTRLVNDVRYIKPEHKECLKKLKIGTIPEKERDRFEVPKACKK